MADRHILSVDWDTRELRVVHARLRRDRVQVEDVFAVSISEQVNLTDAEALGRVLRDALHQERVSCRRVIVDIPRDQAVLNPLSLPDVSVSDLAGMVKVQIGKSLPYPVAEAVVDFAVPPDDGEEGPRDVLVGAVRAEVLDYYRQVCQTAGLKLERVGLRPQANKVAITQFLSGRPPERVLVVDVGPTLTEIDVLRRGQLVFSRAAAVFVPEEASTIKPISAAVRPRGEDTGGDQDEVSLISLDQDYDSRPRDTTAVVADLMVEVTRSIEAYRGGDPGAEMNCAVVAGGTGIEETLAESIQRRFGINAETYNPASYLDGDTERAGGASGFSAALGLVMGHAGEGRLHFDFLNPKKQEVPGRARLKRAPLAAVVVALFVVAAGAWYAQGPARRFAERDRLREQIRETKAQIKANKKFIDMVEPVKAFEAEQVIWVDELKNVVDLLPDSRKVVLNKLDMFQRGKRLEMSLRASDGKQAAQVVEDFEKFRPDDEQKPYYAATRDAQTMSKSPYPHEGKVTVQIVKGVQPSKNKRRR